MLSIFNTHYTLHSFSNHANHAYEPYVQEESLLLLLGGSESLLLTPQTNTADRREEKQNTIHILVSSHFRKWLRMEPTKEQY